MNANTIQVAQQCERVSHQVALNAFVTNNQAQHLNVLPEEVETFVRFDSQQQAIGDIWVLSSAGMFVGWYDEFSGLLFVA